MAPVSPEVRAHQRWLALIRPTGLVVAPSALERAGAIVHERDSEGQRLLREWRERYEGASGRMEPEEAFRTFATSVLGWEFSSDSYGWADKQSELPSPSVSVPEYGETLVADFAVREPDCPVPANGENARGVSEPAASYGPDAASAVGPSLWQLVVQVYGPDQDLDKPLVGPKGFEATPNGRMERLLRETHVPAGVLFNGERLRLISAPRGESSGSMDFVMADLEQAAGRPLVAALRLLMEEPRLLYQPKKERLPSLLSESRKYQNEVSERLAGQVLEGLYELLRGFQSADAELKGALLGDTLRREPAKVYRALLAVMLRLVFLLYAEQRGLLPADATFVRHYSLMALFERLRADAALHPDTMDQRYGAWAHLLALFRLVHDGAESGAMRIPPRHGALFNPDEYSFLEGRPAGARQTHEPIEPPLVSDQTILAVLTRLLVLDRERISYRALDVEQIGSVYETMMGFRLETASGQSLAIRSPKKYGAPTVVNLEELLAVPSGSRGTWIQKATDRKLTPLVLKAVKDASSVEGLHAALDKVVDRRATPDIAPIGALVLQPSEERRRSGSHYTPRSLTEPIVRRTLEPILDRLREAEVSGGPPRPEAILELKVCDPAMGSGAFLVEACRQLGDALMEAWKAHGGRPEIPQDEDETIFARRLVAQKCLYGVDRNPVAVNLAKLSLWLVTLAQDHPLTFLDHALRPGDSLVGLSKKQIVAFDWKEAGGGNLFADKVRGAMETALELRSQIRDAGEDVSDAERHALLTDADNELTSVRLYGDLVIAAFFDGKKPAERENRRRELAADVNGGNAENHCSWLEGLRSSDSPLVPFHWEIEFPEVFERDNPGFDAFVGNPPFAGHVTLATANRLGYTDWLRALHPQGGGKCDVVAHFFRRSFGLLRKTGTLGLIATNTIAQGDTRATGLQVICKEGEIYCATRRYKWPGLAAVIVSVVHIIRGQVEGPRVLDGRRVNQITAFLFHRGMHDDPTRLMANANKSFVGVMVLGMGFTFDDTDTKGVASSLATMRRLLDQDADNGGLVFPYVGGQEVNTSPTHAHHRFVIHFRDYPLRRDDLGFSWRGASGQMRRDCRRTGVVPRDYADPVAADWPGLLEIVENKVKPERLRSSSRSKSSHGHRARTWWQLYHQAKDLYREIGTSSRVLVISRIGQYGAITFLPSGMVYSESLVVFPFDSYAALCALQAQCHQLWARFCGSSMKDDLRYTPSDCFETYPFPDRWELRSDFETIGERYYEHRAKLMVQNDEGMTKTYNRFHDPDENDSAILKLRELHAEMDRAVLDAYGWQDIPTDCEFLPVYPDEGEDDGGSSSQKKKAFRYRWPDEVQEEILARLLELNAQRAAEEKGARIRSIETQP